MNLGESIENLIIANIKLWHKATTIKKDGKPDHTLPTSERVKTFYEIRRLNAERSKLRWDIDSNLGGGSNETKINYHQ